MRRYTSDNIQSLEPHQYIAISTNGTGTHGKGLALIGKQLFGLKQGHCRGICGQTYCIVTKKDWRVRRSSTIAEIGKEIQDMILYFRDNPDKELFIPKIGAENAGYTIGEMKQIFIKLKKWIPDNVILPKEYEVREN